LYSHYFITIQRNVEKERKQLNCNYSDVHPKGTRSLRYLLRGASDVFDQAIELYIGMRKGLIVCR